MKKGALRGGALAVVMVAAAAAAQQSAGPEEFIAKAEKAKAAGDRVAALQNYTEAICIMRQGGASGGKLVGYLNERDRIAASLLTALAALGKKQKEMISLQRDIAQNLSKVVRIDQDVQERVKRNEDRIKNVETELLDAVR